MIRVFSVFDSKECFNGQGNSLSSFAIVLSAILVEEVEKGYVNGYGNVFFCGSV